MAVGETAGQPGRAASSARVAVAAGPKTASRSPRPTATDRGRRRGRAAKPLLGEADPELERLLAEEEEIERRTREHHETPHFRGGEE